MKISARFPILISLLLIIATGLTASATKDFQNFVNEKSTFSNEWELYKSTNEIDIFQKVSLVEDHITGISKEVIVLKIVNKTDRKIRVEWYLKTYYGNSCRSCQLDRPNEYDKSIVLEPNQTKIGDTAIIDNNLCILKGLQIENFRELNKFILDDMKIALLD